MEMEKHGRTLCVLELYSKDSAVGAGVLGKDSRNKPAQGTHSRGEGKQHHRKRREQQPRRACSLIVKAGAISKAQKKHVQREGYRHRNADGTYRKEETA